MDATVESLRTVSILAASCLAFGCSDHPDGFSNGYYPNYPTNILTESIDTGPQLLGNPGSEVGVNVSYSAGGSWHLDTTCDTAASGYACSWDLVVSVRQPAQLSATDPRAVRIDPGAFRVVLPSQTTGDAFDFTAPAGESLELDVVLDGVHGNWANHDLDAWMVGWVKNGATQIGAPSNPIDFLPATP